MMNDNNIQKFNAKILSKSACPFLVIVKNVDKQSTTTKSSEKFRLSAITKLVASLDNNMLIPKGLRAWQT